MNPTVGRYLSHFATAFLLLFCGLFAFAGPSRTTYQAKIVKPDGYPLEASNVNFKFTLLDPSGNCILFAETYTAVNMNSTGGLVSFSLGSGVKTYPVSSPTFEDVFSNISSNLSCDTGGPNSYSPLASDTRKIVMQFHDGGGWQTLPAMNINAVPYAMYATNAEKLGGVSATSFVQDSEIPTCPGGQALTYNGTMFSCIVTSSGSVSAAAIISAIGYTPADSASFTTVSNYASNVSSTVFAVSSTVNSLSNTFVSFQSSVAASFAVLSGSGIGSFNGSASSTQSLGNALTGSTPAFVTVNGVHTLNIPFASAGTTTAGLISNSEYSLFSTVISKITSSAASLAQVLGYTPADNTTVTVLSSTVGSVSASVNSLNSNLNSVSASVATANSGVAAVSASLAVTNSNISSVSSSVSSLSTSTAASFAALTGNPQATSYTATSGIISPIIYGSTSALGSLRLESNASASPGDILMARYGGNVGLGTGQPLAKLYVDSDGLSPNIPHAGAVAVFDNEASDMNISLMTAPNRKASVYFANTGASSRGAISYQMNYDPSFDKMTFNVNSASAVTLDAYNRFGIGVAEPNAKLHIGSGTATAAAIKIVSGTLLASPASGAIEYDGFNFYVTDGANTRRSIATINGSSSFATGNLTASGSLNLSNDANLYLTANVEDPGDIIFQTASGTQKGRIWSNPSVSSTGLFFSSNDTIPDLTIDGSGNVGIGTQFPTEKLEVSGAIKIPGVGQIGPNGVFGYAMYTTGTNSFIGQMYGSASGVQFTNGTGINTMYLGEGGTLGLGTTAPTAKLEVSGTGYLMKLGGNSSGTVAADLILVRRSTSEVVGRGAAIQLDDSSNNNHNVLIQQAQGNLQFFNNGGGGWAERMRITSGGAIGIGDSDPIQKFVMRDATGSKLYLGDTNSNSGIRHVGSVGYRTSAYSGMDAIKFYVQGGTNLDDNLQLAFQTVGNGVIGERMRIDNSGNVGIGTSAPTNTLDVYGIGMTVTRASTFGTIATFKKAYTATSNEDPYVQFTHQTTSGGAFARYGYIQSGINHGGMTIQAENGSSAGGNLMLNKLGGSVGVGTNMPASMTAAFNVVGSSAGEVAQYITNTNTNGYAVLRMNNNWSSNASGTALHSFGAGYGSVGDAYAPLTTTLTGFESGGLNLHAHAGEIRLFTNGNSAANNRLTISTAGNVGIGTSAPVTKAHIYGQVDGSFTGLMIDNRKTYGGGTGVNETSRISFALTESGASNPLTRTMGFIESGVEAENSSAESFMGFGTRISGVESEKMRLNSAGFLGVGTSSPTARLNLGGFGAANATALRIDSQDTYYRDILMTEFNTTGYGGILRYNSGSDLLQMITIEAGVEKYGVSVARATGFVGIGMNSAAAYALDVNGDIRITGTPWRASGDIAWTVPSDARLKDVVKNYDRGLKEILNIDTIVYKYKKDNIKKADSTKEYTGVLAQNVQEQIPEAVSTDKDGFLSLNTTPIFWAMINAIKDLYHEVTGVQREIASLKEDNKAKDQEIKELKDRLDRIEKSLQSK